MVWSFTHRHTNMHLPCKLLSERCPSECWELSSSWRWRDHWGCHWPRAPKCRWCACAPVCLLCVCVCLAHLIGSCSQPHPPRRLNHSQVPTPLHLLTSVFHPHSLIHSFRQTFPLAFTLRLISCCWPRPFGVLSLPSPTMRLLPCICCGKSPRCSVPDHEISPSFPWFLSAWRSNKRISPRDLFACCFFCLGFKLLPCCYVCLVLQRNGLFQQKLFHKATWKISHI